FKNPITPSWLFSDSTRSRFLAALWYLVRAWKAKGRPLERENGKPSFEEWTGLVGGIVTSFGMANPFAARETTSGGDEASRALKMVIAGLVGECEEDTPPVFVTDEILGRAEEMDMLELVVGFAKEPKRALGHRLKKLKGRHLVDSRGRLFEFGKREASAGAKYPVRFL
ncbi:MAG: hypothetical protein Q7R22_003310, partial [Verrucomicrobiota bacterium JB025]|nr:hypothetical protein [Verrucomicrobiota bacterium JB025]